MLLRAHGEVGEGEEVPRQEAWGGTAPGTRASTHGTASSTALAPKAAVYRDPSPNNTITAAVAAPKPSHWT